MNLGHNLPLQGNPRGDLDGSEGRAFRGRAMKKLCDIMLDGFLFVVRYDATVAEAVRIMTSNNVGIVSVLDGDQLVGVFSERDVVQRVVACGLDPAWTLVGNVMTSEIIVGDADEDYQSAIRKMDRANIRHLPVVSEGRVLSMLSIRDLMRVDRHDKDEEIRYLHEYLYQVPPYIPSVGN
jgi:signal-transduction protein with cAMP-binding, CBS, and nucleotidyltransferase domain